MSTPGHEPHGEPRDRPGKVSVQTPRPLTRLGSPIKSSGYFFFVFAQNIQELLDVGPVNWLHHLRERLEHHRQSLARAKPWHASLAALDDMKPMLQLVELSFADELSQALPAAFQAVLLLIEPA